MIEIVPPGEPTLNPLLGVWTRPRQTIRQIVTRNPREAVLPLAAVAGAAKWVMNLFGVLPSMATSVTVSIAAAAGAGFGLIGLYVYGWLYRWVGSWLGGQATAVEVRAAVAWSQVVTLAMFAVWLASRSLPNGQLVHVLGVVVLSAWNVAILSQMLGEVHRFSGWKGFGTLMLPSALLLVPLAALAIVAAVAIPNVLRGRAAGNEQAAIASLQQMSGSLSAYQRARQSYPEAWVQAVRTGGLLAPDGFADLDAQPARHRYRFAYQALPEGCQEPGCWGFRLTATPPAIPGMRAFFVDETGTIRHCRGAAGASRSDPPLDQPASACQPSR